MKFKKFFLSAMVFISILRVVVDIYDYFISKYIQSDKKLVYEAGNGNEMGY